MFRKIKTHILNSFILENLLRFLLAGVIYAFNVKCPPNVNDNARAKNVPIKHFNVIYKLMDDLRDEIQARLPPIQKEEIIGKYYLLLTLKFIFI